MISFWSLFSAFLWFGLASLLLHVLRQHTSFLMHHGVAALSVLVVLTIVRLLLPLDSGHMIVLRSYKLLPALDNALKHELWEGFSIAQLLIGLWISGALLGVAYIVCGVLRDQWRLRQLPVVPMSPQVQAVVQKCDLHTGAVRITSEIFTPMVTGFLHPTIYLPNYEYTESDLFWILKHEASHIAGYDAWLRLGFLLFRCLFWWNPFVHLSQKSVDDILELRCDKAVLSNADTSERVEYVEALYHTANHARQSTLFFAGAGTFVQPKKAGILAVRAKVAMDDPHPHSRKTLAALALTLVLFGVSYIFILQPARFPPPMDDGPEIFQITPETAYLVEVSSDEY